MTHSTNANHPIDTAINIAAARGWEHIKDEKDRNILQVVMPGMYGTRTMFFYWSEFADVLTIRTRLILTDPMPREGVYELYKLTNLMNERSAMGSWYYSDDEHGRGIVWRHEVHTDQSTIDDEQMAAIFAGCSHANDQFYPALASFLSAKPVGQFIDGKFSISEFGLDAEEAFTFIENSFLFGRA